MKKSITSMVLVLLCAFQFSVVADKLNFEEKYWGTGVVLDDETGFQFHAGAKLNTQFGKDLGFTSFGLEVGYIDFGEDTIGNEFASVTYGSSGLYLSAVAKRPLSNNMDLLLKAGILRWSTETETKSIVGNVSTDDSGFDPMFGIGLVYQHSKKMSFVAEYTFFDTGEGDADVLGLGIRFNLN